MWSVADCSYLHSTEQSVIKPSRVSVSSGLALNSQLFVLPKGHSEKLVSVPSAPPPASSIVLSSLH